MTDQSATTPQRTGRWKTVVLIISLALNLAVAGLVIGAVVNRAKYDRDAPRISGEVDGYGPVVAALAPEDRDELRDRLRGEGHRFRDNRREVRESFRQVLAALKADPFDRERVEDLMRAQQERLGDQVRLLNSALLDQVSQMNADERRAMADRLEHLLRRGPPRGGKPRD